MLQAIGAEGFTGLQASGPSAVAAADSLSLFAVGSGRHDQSRLLREARRQGLVDVSQNNKLWRFTLTVKGIHRLQFEQVNQLVIACPAEWDGQWRMVTFDIPARRSESRYILTSQLRRLGFRLLQDSMWVYPYPCFDIVQQLVDYANVQQFVSMAEVLSFDPVTLARLRRLFDPQCSL